MSVRQQPAAKVHVDGKDVTSTIQPRLISLGITSERGQSADQLDLALSDHDGRITLPRTGVLITVALGWQGMPLVDMGSFTVDEVEHAGAPDRTTIRARSADVAGAWRQKRDQSWHDTTLGHLVDVLAGRNDLTPRCAASLADIHIDHIDQTNESDLNILTRIARLWDAVATVKAGCLIFAPIGQGRTATGAALPHATITRAAGDQHRYHAADREAYTGVRAYWQDVHGAERQEVVAGEETTLKTLRQTYGSQDDAMAAATAEWKRVQRGTATFEVQLALGRADIYPETPITVTGFKPGIDGSDWLCKRVEHQLGDNGWTTRVECETGHVAGPKAHG